MQELLDPSSVEAPWSGGHRQLVSHLPSALVRHKVSDYVLLLPHHISLETVPSLSLHRFVLSGLEQGDKIFNFFFLWNSMCGF